MNVFTGECERCISVVLAREQLSGARWSISGVLSTHML